MTHTASYASHLCPDSAAASRSSVHDLRVADTAAGRRLSPALAALMICSAPAPLFAQTPPGKALDEVIVKERRDTPQSTGYQGGQTRVGKTNQLPKDVPQSLTVIPQTLVRDQGGSTLRDALRNASGLTLNAGEGGRIGDNVMLRGFYSFGDIYLDGIRDVAQINREVFNLEQVEVLRGASSMLFGRGTGSVVNQVSKQPMLYEDDSVSATLGTDAHKRITADLNRRLTDTAAFRINLMKTDAGSTRDHVTTRREGIAPSLRWGIGGTDEFTLNYVYTHVDNRPDYGVPYFQNRPLPVPKNRFYGTTSDYEINDSRVATATWLHHFSGDTEIRTALRQARYKRDLWAAAPRLTSSTVLNDLSTVTRIRQARGGEEDNLVLQSDFSTKFETGPLKHQVVAGVEWLREDAQRWNYNGLPNSEAPPTTVGSPDPFTVPANYGNRVRVGQSSYRGTTMSVYGQDIIEFLPGWKVLAGLRSDRLQAEYSNSAQVDYNELSYRGGLIFQPSPFTTYYLSYGDAFSPTADLYQFTTTAAIYPAERSRTVELGGKWELLEGDLSLRASVYRARKTWERNTDIESAQAAAILTRRRHTDGVEFEAAGYLTRRWQVFGGVTFMKARIDEEAPGNNPAVVGMRPRNTPPYTFNLWTTYTFDNGLRLGGGVDMRGTRYAYPLTQGTGPVVPGVVEAYYKIDLMAAWEQKRYSLQLNLLNATNRTFYDQVYDNGGHIVPGTGRAVLLTGTFRF